MKRNLSSKNHIKILIVLLPCFICTILTTSGQNLAQYNESTAYESAYINTCSGNLLLQYYDWHIPNQGPDFEIYFSYNSVRNNINKGYGRGWIFSMGMELTNYGDSVCILMPDGRKEAYYYNGTSYDHQPGAFKTLENSQGYLILTTKHGTEYHFGVAGLPYLSKIVDRNDNVLSFTYTNNHLSEISDQSGRSVNFVWEENLLQSFSDSNTGDTREFTFIYDDEGYLTQRINPQQESTFFTYDQNKINTILDLNETLWEIIYNQDQAVQRFMCYSINYSLNFEYIQAERITELSYNNGSKTYVKAFTYDGLSRLIQIRYEDNNTKAFLWDNQLNIIQTTDELGRELNFSYDEQGNLLEIEDYEGNLSSYSYEGNFNLISSFTDRNGNTTHYNYDENGNQTQIINCELYAEYYTYDAWGNIISHTNLNGATTTYNYDSYGNLHEVTDSMGYTEEYGFDACGKLLQYTDALDNTTTNTYDNLYNLTSVTDSQGNTTTYTYSPAGNMTSITDGEGYSTTYTYNEFNSLEQIQNHDGSTISYSYDEMGRQTEEMNEMGYAIEYEHDARHRITRTTDCLGYSEETVYDAVGQILSQQNKNSEVTQYTYNNAGYLANITNPEGSVRNFMYDNAGNVISQNDFNGNTTSFEYDCLNRLTLVNNPDGSYISYTYDNHSNIISITNEEGATTTYEYDDNNHVISITDALGNSELLNYDAAGNNIQSTDKNGNITTYIYNNLNRLVSTTDPLGHTEQSIFTPNGNLSSKTDKNGNTYQYQYNFRGLVTQKTDPLGINETYTYDLSGRQTSYINKNYETWYYEYDCAGNMVEETDPLGNIELYVFDAGGRVISYTDKNGNSTQYTYSCCNLESITDALGNTISYIYDANHNLTSVTDPLGLETNYLYNNLDQLIQAKDPENNACHYSYSPTGLLLTSTDPEGNSHQFTYDLLGNNTTVQNAMGFLDQSLYDANGNKISYTDKKGNTYTFMYDELNRLTSETDPLGFSKQHTYDGNSNETQFTNKEGHITTNTYNQLNQLISRTDALGNIETYNRDPLGNVLSYTNKRGFTTYYLYDPLNSNTQITDPLGYSHSYTYDPVGNMISETNKNGFTTHYQYDAVNQLTGTTYPDGSSSSITYNAVGLQTHLTNPLGNTETRIYSPARRLLSKTDPLGNTVQYAYDGVGNVTSYTDPGGSITNYTYDVLNLPININNGGQIIYYQYDANGNKTQVLDEMNNPTHYFYNEMNRLSGINYPDGTNVMITYTPEGNKATYINQSGQIINFSYDSLHKKTSKSWNNETIDSFYDENGNRTQIIHNGFSNDIITKTYTERDELASVSVDYGNGIVKTTTHTYDPVGNLLTTTLPGGSTKTYTYNSNNQVTGISSAKDVMYALQYDPAGRRTSLTYPNGMTDTYMYDAANRITGKQIALSNKTIISDFSWTYSIHGNRTSETNLAGETTFYDYDPWHRLSSVTDPMGDIAWQYMYNAVGSITEKIHYGVSTTYTYDPMGRLISDMENNYTYDINGNLATIYGSSGDNFFTYNPFGQLTEFTSPEGSISFFYSGDNERIRSVESTPHGTDERLFLYDYSGFGSKMPGHPACYPLLEVYNETGFPIQKFTQGPSVDEHLAMETMGDNFYYIWDPLKSTRAIVDESGNMVSEYDYEPYGGDNGSVDPTGNPFGFAGRYYESLPDIYYNRYRYYNTNTGSFISPDPWGKANGTNEYPYGLDNPFTYSDPSGCKWVIPNIPVPEGRDFVIVTGGPKKPIIKHESEVTYRRNPDFELLIKIHKIYKGKPLEYGKDPRQIRNRRVYKKGDRCYDVWDQYNVVPRYKRKTTVYYGLWLKVKHDKKAIKTSDRLAKSAKKYSAFASFSSAVSLGSGIFPGVGTVISVASGLAAEKMSRIAGEKNEKARNILKKAIAKAKVGVKYLSYASVGEKKRISDEVTLLEKDRMGQGYPCPDNYILDHNDKITKKVHRYTSEYIRFKPQSAVTSMGRDYDPWKYYPPTIDLLKILSGRGSKNNPVSEKPPIKHSNKPQGSDGVPFYFEDWEKRLTHERLGFTSFKILRNNSILWD